MNFVISFGGIILRIVFLLMIILNRISHIVIPFVSNILMIIIMFVVGSIFIFVQYYMDSDVSNENFKLVIIMFLLLMILILSSYNILIFVRWERIGVISILLIGYWIRPSRKSRAISAIMYNR